MLEQINSDIDAIDDYLRAQNRTRKGQPRMDLVLERLQREDGSSYTLYYLADHSKRCIFFVDEFDTAELSSWREIKGMTCPTHLGTLVP